MAEPEQPDGKEPTVIICGSTPQGIEGTAERECSLCGTAVYIAPSGLRIEERTGAELVCFECGIAGMKKAKEKGEEIKLMPPQPEQRREIVEEMKRQFLRDLRKRTGNGGWLKL